MQGSFNSRTYNFNALLGRTSFPDLSVKKVVVPAFQRGYSWEKSHVATYWEDILQFHNQVGTTTSIDTYFLGPIVVMPTKDEVTLLDGQQRLATTTILLSVLRDIARAEGGQAGSDLARDIQRDLICLDQEDDPFALKLSELDNAYFETSIQDDPPDHNSAATLRSHILIKQARAHLESEVAKILSGKKPQDIVKLLKAFKVTLAEKIKIVVIEVGSEDEAFLIFETLNDRGLRLTVPDLLLNHLMKEANTVAARTKVRNFWNDLVENIGTRPVSAFLRHMWVSMYGDVKAQGLFKEIKASLKSTGTPSVQFSKECSEQSEKYVAILDLEKAVLKSAEPHIRGILKGLGADMALPLLLSGLSCLDESDFEKLSRLVSAILVRYALIANLNPAPLEETFHAAARTIRDDISKSKTSAKTLLVVKTMLKKLDPTKKQLVEGAANLLLKKSQAQYLLVEIAKKMQSPSKALTFEKISIEHVFPINATKAEWPNFVELMPHVWHLGNLTILEPKLNKDLGNKSYHNKKPILLKSEVVMTHILAKDNPTWDAKVVIDRAEKMVAQVEQIWNLA